MGDRGSINASYGGRQSGADGEAIMASFGGAAGGVALFSSFPRLAAARNAGLGRISNPGDSVAMAWASGTGTNGLIGADTFTPMSFLRDRLIARGVPSTTNCFSFGDKNAAAYGSSTNEISAYYTPAISYGASWDLQSGLASPWGAGLYRDPAGPTSTTFTPTGTYDRLMIVNNKFSGLGTFTLTRGGVVIATVDESGPTGASFVTFSFTPGSGPITINRTAGATIFPCAARVWNSASPNQVQCEQLGVSGWQTSDWLVNTNAFSPRPMLTNLASDLAIVNLGVNDKFFGRSIAAFKADLKTIYATLIASNIDVMPVIPHLGRNPAEGHYFDGGWPTAVYEAASEMGLPTPCNLQTIGLVAGDYADDIHLKPTGLGKIGAAYDARLAA